MGTLDVDEVDQGYQADVEEVDTVSVLLRCRVRLSCRPGVAGDGTVGPEGRDVPGTDVTASTPLLGLVGPRPSSSPSLPDGSSVCHRDHSRVPGTVIYSHPRWNPFEDRRCHRTPETCVLERI